MQCEEANELMSLRLDNQLAPDRHTHLQAHLTECPTCRAQWAALAQVSAILQAAPMKEPPPGFTAQVMRYVSHRTTPRLAAGASLLLGWTVLLGWVIMLPLAGLLTLLWQIARDPSAMHLAQSALSKATATVRVVLEAGWLVLQLLLHLFPPPLWVLYAGAAVILIALWTVIMWRVQSLAPSTRTH